MKLLEHVYRMQEIAGLNPAQTAAVSLCVVYALHCFCTCTLLPVMVVVFFNELLIARWTML